MEKMLKEILEKLNFLLSNTFVQLEDKTVKNLMEIYQKMKKNECLETEYDVDVSDDKMIRTLITQAHQTGKFKISGDRRWVYVEYGIPLTTYRIPYKKFTNG